LTSFKSSGRLPAVAPPPTVAPVREGFILLWANTDLPYSRLVGRLSRDRIHDSSLSDEEPFLDLVIPSDVHHAAALGAGGALPGGGQVRAFSRLLRAAKSRYARTLFK
jgi:hypothetical protein